MINNIFPNFYKFARKQFPDRIPWNSSCVFSVSFVTSYVCFERNKWTWNSIVAQSGRQFILSHSWSWQDVPQIDPASMFAHSIGRANSLVFFLYLTTLKKCVFLHVNTHTHTIMRIQYFFGGGWGIGPKNYYHFFCRRGKVLMPFLFNNSIC